MKRKAAGGRSPVPVGWRPERLRPPLWTRDRDDGPRVAGSGAPAGGAGDRDPDRKQAPTRTGITHLE
jgi:hypothetical protein